MFQYLEKLSTLLLELQRL